MKLISASYFLLLLIWVGQFCAVEIGEERNVQVESPMTQEERNRLISDPSNSREDNNNNEEMRGQTVTAIDSSITHPGQGNEVQRDESAQLQYPSPAAKTILALSVLGYILLVGYHIYDNPVTLKVPATNHSLAYIKLNDNAIMNEAQVSISNWQFKVRMRNAISSSSRSSKQLASSKLSQFALEKCQTSRQATYLIANLVEQFGINEHSVGTAFIIGDPMEAWVLHIASDHNGLSAVWVAQRVPQEHIAFVGNTFSIRHVDPKSNDFLYSANLWDVAEQEGWWTKANGLLDFKAVYGVKPKHSSISQIHQWLSMAAPSSKLPATDEEMPFAIKLEKSLTLNDIMQFRLQYADKNAIKVGYSYIAESRRAEPNELGRFWYTPYSSDVSSYTPIYVASHSIPLPYAGEKTHKFTPDSAWYNFAKVDLLASNNYKEAMAPRLALQKQLQDQSIGNADLFEVELKARLLRSSGKYENNGAIESRLVSQYFPENEPNLLAAYYDKVANLKPRNTTFMAEYEDSISRIMAQNTFYNNNYEALSSDKAEMLRRQSLQQDQVDLAKVGEAGASSFAPTRTSNSSWFGEVFRTQDVGSSLTKFTVLQGHEISDAWRRFSPIFEVYMVNVSLNKAILAVTSLDTPEETNDLIQVNSEYGSDSNPLMGAVNHESNDSSSLLVIFAVITITIITVVGVVTYIFWKSAKRFCILPCDALKVSDLKVSDDSEANPEDAESAKFAKHPNNINSYGTIANDRGKTSLLASLLMKIMNCFRGSDI